MYRVQPLGPDEDPAISPSVLSFSHTPPAPRRSLLSPSSKTVKSASTSSSPRPFVTRSLSHSASTPSLSAMAGSGKSVGPTRTMVAIALVCLCVQNSALVLSMKYTRSVLQETYLTSTAVVMMECVKFALSWLMMYRDGARTKDVMCQRPQLQLTASQHCRCPPAGLVD